MMKRILLYLSLVCFPLSCDISQQETDGKDISDGYRNVSSYYGKQTEEIPKVTSKGIIRSRHDIPIYARLSSVVEKSDLIEGMPVKQGQELVLLDSKELALSVKLEQNQLDQAIFQYKTILVGQGYVPENEENIPESIKKAARVRSSVEYSESRLENAKLYLSYCTIKAPVDGVITDLRIHQYDFVKEGDLLFHVVDTDDLVVEFFVLETDLKFFKPGINILVHPIAEEERGLTAVVRSISKKVNDSGMVKIKAQLNETEGILVGMNVFITLL